jgi:Family of unknown function (DUF5343)
LLTREKMKEVSKMALEQDGPAPYGPPGPLLTVLERYRDRGLQTPFTNDVLVRAGVNESLSRRVLQALKLLDLVDEDGDPATVLQEYARAPEEEARTLLRQVVESAYAPVFAFVDPRTDPPDRIRDAFRSYEPRGQQDRMVTLFLGLCEHVGIIEQVVKRQPGPKRPRNQKPVAVDPSLRARRAKSDGAGQQATVPAGLPPAVEGMLNELAKIGPTWTRDRRDQYMKVMEAVIDFSFPVREPGDNADDGEM